MRTLLRRHSVGMYSLTWEDVTPSGMQSQPTWRLQIYWPEVTLRDSRGWNLFLGIAFCIRLVWGNYSGNYLGSYRGFGFKFLGFGFGFDRQEYKQK